MRQIKQPELKKLRKHFHKKQQNICPILKQKIPCEDMVVDHIHRTKKDRVGENNKGLIRGIIQRSANVIEGKLVNSFVRYGLHKFNITVPEFLRNLADYIENPPLIKFKYIHPSEAPKPKKLSKRSFNKIEKLYTKEFPNRGKILYPKRKYLTIKLQKLFQKYNITPEFLK